MRKPAGPLELLVTALFAAALVAVAVSMLAFDAYTIPSGSMEPTLQIDDRVLARTAFVDPEVGDIVIYEGEVQGQLSDRVSRIVARSGDRIGERDGRLVRNGDPLDEPYLAPGTATPPFPTIDVGDGEVFVLGDNRGNSSDSRIEGPLDADAVVAEVMGTGLPLDWFAVGAAAGSGLMVVVLLRRPRHQPISPAT